MPQSCPLSILLITVAIFALSAISVHAQPAGIPQDPFSHPINKFFETGSQHVRGGLLDATSKGSEDAKPVIPIDVVDEQLTRVGVPDDTQALVRIILGEVLSERPPTRPDESHGLPTATEDAFTVSPAEKCVTCQ